MSRCVVILSSCLFLFFFGCSKPYNIPLVIPEKGTFSGINNVIYMPGNRAVSLIMIHGMCHHDKEWVSQKAQRFGKILGMDLGRLETISDGGSSGVSAYRIDLKGSDRQASLFGIIYSSATLESKNKNLCRDTSQTTDVCIETTYRHKRAGLNADFKNELVNNCLADAVIYFGHEGGKIRKGVREVLEQINTNRERDSSLNNSPVIMLSESLGSKILKDSLLCDETSIMEKIQPILGEVTQVFLEANQIPLLNLGEKGEECNSSQKDFLKQVDESRKRVHGNKHLNMPFNPVKVVSFTDPNDLLSYEVMPEDYGQREVINILVSNANTWFGLFENPLAAHMGYRENRNVMDFIACGRESDGASVCKKN